MILRTSVLVYVLLGILFIAWQSRRWWAETERGARKLMDETIGYGPLAWALVIVLTLVSLVCFDLALWPGIAWRMWMQARAREDE
jgi:hypothetical protein